MEQKSKVAIILSDNSDLFEVLESSLDKCGFSCLQYRDISECLRDIEDKEIEFVTIDVDSVGVQARELITSIRTNEEKVSIKHKCPILITGSVASIFNRYFTHFDNVKFIEAPFEEAILVQKIKSFFESEDTSHLE